MAASGIAAGLGGGAMARMMADSAALKTRYESLLRQSGDGRVGDRYGDLAPQARLSLDLKGEIVRREATAEGISRALSRTGVAQKALGRLSEIARQFGGLTNTLDFAKTAEIASVASAARTALAEMGALLNERSGGEYVFSGSDTANPPLPVSDLGAGGMAARIAAAVAAMGPSPAPDAAATLAETADAALNPGAAETPFSAHLEGAGATEARRTSLMDDGTALPTGLWASRNTDAAAGQPSWSRSLMRSLMTLAALPGATNATPAQIGAVLSDVRVGLASANDALALEQGTLGLTEAQLEAASKRHGEVVTVLKGQVASIEEVDMAAALIAANEARTRLEASWRALAALGQMSLADFLR